MTVSLKGRNAIVTGAAVGIGNAYAKALAREGCNVAVIDIRADIADLPKELEKSGVRSFAVQGDVSKPEDVRRFVDQVASTFGGIDILINNAGQCWVSLVDDDLEKSEKDYEGMVGTNLKGEYLMGRAVIPLMLKAGKGGEIINIGTDHFFMWNRPARGTRRRAPPVAAPCSTSTTPASTAPMRSASPGPRRCGPATSGSTVSAWAPRIPT